jgi:hypothetical protein
MVHYSVIIPERDCGEALLEQVPRLRAQLACLRLLRLEAPAGTSTALSAGIAAARGDILIAIEAGDRYSVEQLPHLIARLSRLDLVVGRLRLGAWRKFWHRLGRIPRWALLGLDVRHPDCLFWAARREAVEGIHLPRGMRRYLPWLVARRGFRVGDVYVKASGRPTRLHDPPGNPLDLLTAWWTCRRWRNDEAHEIRIARGECTLARRASEGS